MKKVLILGAAGNVGKGLTEAFFLAGWKVYAVDPAFTKSTDECSSDLIHISLTSVGQENGIGHIMRFQIKLEEIGETAIMNELLEGYECEGNKKTPLIVCYAAEDGNRDNYATHPALATENVHRFSCFVANLSKLISCHQVSINKTKDECTNADSFRISSISAAVHIFYCGGSWTRRQMDNDFIVCDESPVKQNGGDNPYERAKSLSCSCSEKVAVQHKDWCRITFIDYISVVPNFSPNFSIGKMVEEAVNEGKIVYSKGPFGRPLLHTREAGRIIVQLATKIISGNGHEINQSQSPFEVLLLPGCFILFEQFATIVRAVIASDESVHFEEEEIVLKEQDFTPSFLRSQCISKYIQQETGISPDLSMILDALKLCAKQSLSRHCNKTDK